MTAAATSRPPARRSSRAAAAAAAAALAACLTWTAAAPAAETIVPRGAGLSGPTAALQTPDGARWVADNLLGVCRVADGGAHLVHDLYCSNAELEPHAGPIKGAGLAFDPVTSSFYSGDLQSNAGALWRLHWDAQTGRIDQATRILDLGGDRMTGLALRPASATQPAALAYVTKRSALVRWLADPSDGPQAPATIGAARGQSPAGVAVLGDHVYVAEGSGVTRLPVDGRAGTAAVEVPGTAGLAASALAADHDRGRLYIGTTVPDLRDDVVVLDAATGTVETYASGFTGITGLGVGADGDVLVTDDPGLAAGNIDSLDQGRLFRVALVGLGRARTTITSAPAGWSNAASVAFAFTAGARDATFECRLDGAAWEPCEAAEKRYDDLPEGPHGFEARAITSAGTGLPARYAFVLDRTAPGVTIAAPGATVVRGTGRLDLVATETAVTFACAVDGAAPEPCEPGQALPDLEPGEHTLRATATDASGNTSVPGASRTFTVTVPAPAPVPTPVATPVPASTPAAQAAPAPSASPAAAPAPPATAQPAGEVLAGVAGSRPRVVLLRVTPNRVKARAGLRTVKVSFVVTGQADTARIAVLAGRSERLVLQRAVQLGPEGEQLVTLRLGRGERLRRGLYRVTVTVRGATGESNRGDHRLRIRS